MGDTGGTGCVLGVGGAGEGPPGRAPDGARRGPRGRVLESWGGPSQAVLRPPFSYFLPFPSALCLPFSTCPFLYRVGASSPTPALLSRLWAKTGLQLRFGESRKHSRPYPEAHALPGHPSPLPPPGVPNSKLEWGLCPGVPRTWRRGQHVSCAPWVPWRVLAGRAGPCPGRSVLGPPTEPQDLRGGAPLALIPLIPEEPQGISFRNKFSLVPRHRGGGGAGSSGDWKTGGADKSRLRLVSSLSPSHTESWELPGAVKQPGCPISTL